ncbi:MAG TPA: nuclear transport factor 2 family protein [Thermomicrobiales bacterium]|nr:nuclear transport factor 2 family protein [Thermomicrobiales bacterium]
MADEQILALVQQWADAEQRGDVDFMARNLVDDFVGVGPRGFTLTKEQWLARYQSGDLHNESITVDELAVRVYGEAAVAIGRQTQRTQYQGRDVSGRFRAALILARRDGRWLIAGWQASGPIPDMPPGRG